MKKIITIIIATLLLLTTLGGCSCNNAVALTFTNAFYGEGTITDDNISSSFSERLEYDVNYINDKKNYPALVRDSAVDKVLTIDQNTYTDGKYTTDLSVKPYPNDYPESAVAKKLNTDENGVPYKVFCLTTRFEIKVKYNLKNDDNVYTDYIDTEVYFCLSENSYAPIYAKTSSEETRLTITDNGASIMRTRSTTETVYQISKYKIKTVITEATGAAEEKVIYSKTKTHSNVAKTAVDNTQLFFVLRNKSTKKESASSIPVVSPAYGAKKDLSISHKSNSQITVNIDYNGTVVNEKIPVRNLTFSLSSTNTSGKAQHLTYQTGVSENNGINRNTALLVEYVEPLIAYGSMNSLGALKFTLAKVTQTY
ncbi:MAG: hypothetical protein IJV99_02910 [Clostridia bacterium]|nr:hypothetical protein [Clostridia bacterium]